jgi:chromosome segregation ATPase
MMNPFDGLSHISLQDARLNRLNRLANLRKESKHLREKLSDVRSELQSTQFELDQIKHCLNAEQVLPFKAKGPIDIQSIEPSTRAVKKRSA